VLRWCSSRRDHKTGNSRVQETTALPVIEVSKNLLSIALWDARYIHIHACSTLYASLNNNFCKIQLS